MTSEYRTPDYTLLESYALSLPRLLLDYISGRKTFVSATSTDVPQSIGLFLSNGNWRCLQARGSILTSLSFSSPRYQPSLELYHGLSGTLPCPYPLTPYDSVNDYHVAHAKGLQVMNVMERLGLGEAQGLMSIWSKKGIVVHRQFYDDRHLNAGS